MLLHKKLTPEEALEAILFAVLIRDLPEGFQAELTAEYDEEGNVEIFVNPEKQEEDKKLLC
jgi:hypothetical protein